MEPIRVWKNLIQSNFSEAELSTRLKEVYCNNRPWNVEVLLNSYCPSTCQHCIYSPDYHLFNKNIGSSEWDAIFEKAYNDYLFRNYIFNGRFFDQNHVQTIRSFREKFADITIGVVTAGNISDETVEELIEVAPNWIDVSLDGLAKYHDIQRNQRGSYKRTVRILKKFRDSGVIEKVNVLTCLTTINIDSVLDMITLLNNEGFQNFFITPITIIKGCRPDPRLRPSQNELVNFIDGMMEKVKQLSDTWLEINLFEALYAHQILQLRPVIFENSTIDYDHFEFVTEENDNEIHICYYPSSLTGIREFIINSNGDIILPKVIAMGKIPDELIFGNIFSLKGGPSLFKELVDASAFSFYLSELKEEAKLLRDSSYFKRRDKNSETIS